MTRCLPLVTERAGRCSSIAVRRKANEDQVGNLFFLDNKSIGPRGLSRLQGGENEECRNVIAVSDDGHYRLHLRRRQPGLRPSPRCIVVAGLRIPVTFCP